MYLFRLLLTSSLEIHSCWLGFSAIIHQISANVATIHGKWKDIISCTPVLVPFVEFSISVENECGAPARWWRTRRTSAAHTTLIEWPTRSVPTQANYSCNSSNRCPTQIVELLLTYNVLKKSFIKLTFVLTTHLFPALTNANAAFSLRSFLKLFSFCIQRSGT